MQTQAQLQRRLDAAFGNYLQLTDALRDDLTQMLASESAAQHWRRNFVRASVAMLEGHAYSLRQICAVALRCHAPPISAKERRAIRDDSGFDANNRLKLTLRAAYKLHSLSPLPQFGGSEWRQAQKLMKKRHRLMHPTSPRDLGMADSTWRDYKRSIIWLSEQFSDFLKLLARKHDS